MEFLFKIILRLAAVVYFFAVIAAIIITLIPSAMIWMVTGIMPAQRLFNHLEWVEDRLRKI